MFVDYSCYPIYFKPKQLGPTIIFGLFSIVMKRHQEYFRGIGNWIQYQDIQAFICYKVSVTAEQ